MYTGFGLSLNDDRQLKSLDISGCYFDRINEFSDRLKYPFLVCKCELIKYSCGAFVSINGDDIDDELFKYLTANHGFDLAEHLIIRDTSLSMDVFLGFMELPVLRKIDITDKRTAIEAVLKSLKQKRPDLQITLNEKEIM